jgi:GTP pyrophosphokinase
LYRKVLKTGKTLTEINDTLGIRIIVDEIEDCYKALSILERQIGLTEGVYEQGKRYRDWIVSPKPNQYQSIHTTILFETRWLEVQIRTQAMHEIAEYGAAAHWLYRKSGNSGGQQKRYKDYIEQISLLRRKYIRNSNTTK